MSRSVRSRLLIGAFLLALALVLAGCGGGGGGGGQKEEDTKAEKGGGAAGQIAVEGSSTVQPITQAAAEAFNQQNRDVQITVGGAGTGDGFQAFVTYDKRLLAAADALGLPVASPGGLPVASPGG